MGNDPMRCRFGASSAKARASAADRIFGWPALDRGAVAKHHDGVRRKLGPWTARAVAHKVKLAPFSLLRRSGDWDPMCVTQSTRHIGSSAESFFSCLPFTPDPVGVHHMACLS